MNKPTAHFYRDPINMRLSPQKLADFVRWSGTKLESGDLFIFFNTKRTQCRVVWHDSEILHSLEKRLERGTFAPSNKIKLTQDTIENCLYGGLLGQKELLHALMGNVIYLDDARSKSKQR